MQRVLAPGGYLFLTFPWISPIRRLKIVLGFINKNDFQDSPEGFYQFSLSNKTVEEDLRKKGFSVVESYGHSPLVGLKEEFPFLKRIIDKPGRIGNLFRRALSITGFVFGHTRLIVASKN